MANWWEGDAIANPTSSERWWESDAPADTGSRPISKRLGDVLDTTGPGRVLKAFGDGLTEKWGPDSLGLSDHSAQVLQKWGLFKTAEQSVFDGFKAFNEALIRPAAAGLDFVFRAPAAVVGGGAAAVNQMLTGREDKSFERDMMALFDTTAIVTGNAPPTRLRNPNRAPNRQVERAFERAREFDERPPAPAVADAVVAAPDTPVPDGVATTPDVLPTTRAAATDGLKPDAVVASEPDFGVTPARPELPPPPEGPPPGVIDRRDGTTVDKAGNINLDRIGTTDDVKQLIRDVVDQNGGYTDARRGVMTFEETEALADTAGIVDKAKRRKIGELYNAEEGLALRQALVQAAEDVKKKLADVKAGGNGDKAILEASAAMERLDMLAAAASGDAAEAGRALNARKIMAGQTEAAVDLATVIRDLGGKAKIEDIARMADQLDSPGAIAKFTRDARKATTGDMIVEAWVNAILSGYETHLVNIASNSLTAFWSTVETGVAATIGAVTRNPERIRFGEVGAEAWGALEGMKDGARAGLRAFINEEYSGIGTKAEQGRPKAIPSKTLDLFGYDVQIGGKQARIPGRLLAAEDEFFKAVAYRQELRAQAYRQAAKEDLSGQSFIERVVELTENPTDEMTAAARERADYQTFNRDPGKVGQALMDLSNSHPVMKIPLTFVRTPANILMWANERAPTALLSSEVRANLRGENGAAMRDRQIARIVTGSAVMATVASYAAEGLITGGGPKDPEQQAVWRLAGFQPYSIKIDGRWVPYNRMDPIATIIGATADVVAVGDAMTTEQKDNIVATLVGAAGRNLMDKTWTKGMADFMAAVSDMDGQRGDRDRYFRNLAASAVPSFIAQAARLDDNVVRDVRTTVDAFRDRIPGEREKLPAKIDIFGNPITPNRLYGKEISADPVARELLKLQRFPEAVERKWGQVELKPQEYERYATVAGRLAHEQLTNLVMTPGWDQAPAFARDEVIKNVFSRSRQAAKGLMLLENSDLRQRVFDDRMSKLDKKPAELPPFAR